MPILTAPLDGQTPLVDKQGRASKYFEGLWLALTDRVQAAPFATAGQIVQVFAADGLAAILATALVVSVSSPLYRISYALRVATAAGVSSAAQVTIGWTEGGIAQTRVGANVNGNTTTSKDTDVFLIRPDAGTVVTYAVSYASVGGPAMAFTVDVVAEALG